MQMLDNDVSPANRSTLAPDSIGRTLRGVVLIAYLIGMAGAAAELSLIRHVDGISQIIPLALIGVSFLALLSLSVVPGKMTLAAFRGTTLLILLSGVLGIALHFQANIEWVEEDPSLTGWRLLWHALLRGKNPPVLAPGAMIQFAILGLAYTYRYPIVMHRSAISVPQLERVV